jgi:hypothetical protein
MVNENVTAGVTARNPKGSTKFQELQEIRAMHVSVAGVATAEVRDALAS